MSLEPNDETWTSGLLDDLFLHIPAETTTTEKESGEKDTCDQSRSKGKESELHNIQDHHHGSGVHVVAKKQDHNAKERLRRMRLHSSYITLGTLLPDPSSSSSSSKKKWCAPSIMDRVVTYIPMLHSEVQELTHRKQQLVKTIEKKSSRELERKDPHNRAISVLELGGSGDEVVVQISMRKEKEEEFSNLLHVMEVQAFSILSASTTLLCPNQTVVCYNFHLKMNGKPCEGDDYITGLKNNIISSLS